MNQLNNKIVSTAIKTTCKDKLIYIIFLVIAIIAGILMQLVPPQILKNIIDNNISKGIYDSVWKLSIYYLLSIVLGGAADFTEYMMAILGKIYC